MSKKTKITDLRHGIARKFIFHLFWFTTLITFLITGIELCYDYSKDVELIENRMDQVKDSYLDSIKISLWELDKKLLKTQLEGILNLPDIQSIKIVDKNNKSIVIVRKSKSEQVISDKVDLYYFYKILIAVVGTAESEQVISREFRLTYFYKGKDELLGTLYVVASLEGVYQRLYDKFIVVLGIKLIKSFILSAFLFIIFYLLVGRHLHSMANQAKSLDLNRLTSHFALNRQFAKPAKHDELDQLTHAFNEMCDNINSSLEALRDSEEKVRLILDSAAEAIYGIDQNGKCTFCNPSCLRLLGYSKPSDLIGQNMHKLIHHTKINGLPYSAKDCPICQAYGKGEKSHVTDEVFWRSDKTGLSVEYWSYPIIHNDEITGSVVTFMDITERKETENLIRLQVRQLLQVNKELEEFNYMASHDLQEPLRTMSSYCGFLKSDIGKPLSPDVEEDIKFISDASSRMRVLVQDILMLSKTGRTQINIEDTDLNECMNQAVLDLETRIKEANTHVEWDNLPVVQGDGAHLTRVLQNLVSNAIKFRGNDPLHIKVSARPTGDFWEITVTDNGIGIEKDYLEQIFTPFKRLHGVGKYEGSGIGLAVCRKIVEQHGGRIKVKSSAGKGCQFIFTLKDSNIK